MSQLQVAFFEDAFTARVQLIVFLTILCYVLLFIFCFLSTLELESNSVLHNLTELPEDGNNKKPSLSYFVDSKSDDLEHTFSTAAFAFKYGTQPSRYVATSLHNSTLSHN